jgi:hypothetical protein
MKLLKSFLQVTINHHSLIYMIYMFITLYLLLNSTVGTVEGLLKDLPALTSILSYHVLSGKVLAVAVVTLDGKKVKTLNGAEVGVSVGADGGVKVNSAKVITTDIITDNGVIHVIDTVLVPPTAPVAPKVPAFNPKYIDFYRNQME